MPKVSVVIPVYNVESYIERCLHSLFGQTLDDIEYIFVDDCSTDGSVAKITELLEWYPHRKYLTRILRHDANLGVAAARTTGIKAATGEYLIHCDPDDYAELDIYETMYNKGIDADADLVACSYWEEWNNKKELVNRHYAQTPQECLRNIYKKNCHCSRLWDKMVRRALIVRHDILPFEGCDYAEDLGCVVRILYYAASIAVVEWPLYHYCRRKDSITHCARSVDFWHMRKRIIDRICEFLRRDVRYEIACHQMQFYAKMECRAAFDGKESEWFLVYRDSHRHILRYNDMPLKGRILWWLALHSYATFRMAGRLIPAFR